MFTHLHAASSSNLAVMGFPNLAHIPSLIHVARWVSKNLATFSFGIRMPYRFALRLGLDQGVLVLVGTSDEGLLEKFNS